MYAADHRGVDRSNAVSSPSPRRHRRASSSTSRSVASAAPTCTPTNRAGRTTRRSAATSGPARSRRSAPTCDRLTEGQGSSSPPRRPGPLHRLPGRAGRTLPGRLPVRGRAGRAGPAPRRLRTAPWRSPPTRGGHRAHPPPTDGRAGRAVHRGVPRRAVEPAAARRHRRRAGAGPIGLATLQWVRAAGAGHVVVVEPNAERGRPGRRARGHRRRRAGGTGGRADRRAHPRPRRRHRVRMRRPAGRRRVGRRPHPARWSDVPHRAGRCRTRRSRPESWLVKEIAVTALAGLLPRGVRAGRWA